MFFIINVTKLGIVAQLRTPQRGNMYREKGAQIHIDEYITAFSGTQNINNRWVRMAEIIPWEEFEDEYAAKFGETGNVAYPLRMALGTLIIKK